jgi:hypothetical protein
MRQRIIVLCAIFFVFAPAYAAAPLVPTLAEVGSGSMAEIRRLLRATGWLRPTPKNGRAGASKESLEANLTS